jgi:hypothetical protein
VTEQHTYCAATNCTRRGEHLETCPQNNDCTGCWPRTADHGHLCQRHYDRIDHALQTANRLETALAGVERAIRAHSSSSTVAGPRLPLTAWQMDLDAIVRARRAVDPDLDVWVSTLQGAREALDFARLVHLAERRHPLEDRATEMRFVRCGGCLQRTVVLRPPDWYTGYRTLECTDPECGWSTNDEDHAEAGAYVEALVRDPYPQPKVTIPDQPIDLAQMQALARALR